MLWENRSPLRQFHSIFSTLVVAAALVALTVLGVYGIELSLMILYGLLLLFTAVLAIIHLLFA